MKKPSIEDRFVSFFVSLFSANVTILLACHVWHQFGISDFQAMSFIFSAAQEGDYLFYTFILLLLIGCIYDILLVPWVMKKLASPE